MVNQLNNYHGKRQVCDQPLVFRFNEFDANAPRHLTGSNLVTCSSVAAERGSLFVFTNRWASSSIWRLATTLAQAEEDYSQTGVKIVLVGPAKFLEQARKLAAVLGIQFDLRTIDHDSVKSLTNLIEIKSGNEKLSFLLADPQGYPFYWQDTDKLTLTEQLKRLFLATDLFGSHILCHQTRTT